MTAHGDRFRVGVVRGKDLSAVASASAIVVVVEAPHQSVHDRPHVELPETRKDISRKHPAIGAARGSTERQR